MRKLLFSRHTEAIQPIRILITKQKHQTIIQWAMECANIFLNIFEGKIPNDNRPRNSLFKANLWAGGQIKMPEAKRAILDCHKAATDAKAFPAIEAAARAIAHAAASVHVETHAIGLIIYGLTALVYNREESIIEQYLDYFYDRLLHYQDHYDSNDNNWAAFILKDKPNKEAILLKKIKTLKIDNE